MKPNSHLADLQVVRYRDRPDLWDDAGDLFAGVWPEYNMHGDVIASHWGRLFEEFPQWQFALLGHDGQAVARGQSIPVAWDGTDAGLGPGIDAMMNAGFELRSAGGEPTVLSALSAVIAPRHQSQGLAPAVLSAMSALAAEAGLTDLIAPVRPNLKERYPAIAIERYARWVRPDGLPFDPWMRVHARLGARMGPAVPRSMSITGTVADWESWVQMQFPETADYVFPAGLTTVHIDREQDVGHYWEPNVWMIHPLLDGRP
jgi:GNAT superfamily N-acetyltransferase